MWHSSSRGPALVEKFTHMSGTYGNNDDCDNDFLLYDQDGDDDDETQVP